MAFTEPVQAPPQPLLLSAADRATLRQYAADTWQSFAALAYPGGLPADTIDASGGRAPYTSPTNIAAYLWSAIAARDLQIIPPLEARRRIAATLQTLAALERHPASGMYYNWYNPQTGALLTTWPAGGGKVYPFLSSVDNGWLAAALIVVSNSLPELGEQAAALLNGMNFGFFLNPQAGQLYGGCWPEPGPNRNIHGYTDYHFGALNTEPRIASYIGIAMGDLPPAHYFRLMRALPEMEGDEVPQRWLGVDVPEGHCTYAGMSIVPSWGGSMFEALMVPLFVPEAEWGPRSWGINHPLYVQAQIHHGLREARYGFWGFSPAANPSGGYSAYGLDAIGMQGDGYPSNNDNLLAGRGSTVYSNGVVTPHAVFLALPFAPGEALQNLANLRQTFDIYGPWGFWDSVNVSSGQVARCALALDQGMVMAALHNALCANAMQRYFSQGMVEKTIRPLLEMESFSPARPGINLTG